MTWATDKLGNLCLKVCSGGTPLRSIPEYYENGTIPWLKTGEVKKGVIFDTEEKISESGLENSSAKLVPKNSVIVAMYGDGDTAGNVAINKVPLTTNQACCNFTLNPKKAHYRFIYFYLKGSYNNLINLKLGGSQQNLNAQSLKNFPITHPSVEVQEKIAAILCAYDDLIENNRRRIALLEKMAEELYREWFVRMRFPGHDKVKKVKGVPEGWGVKQFHEIVEYYIGGGWGEDDQSTTFCEAAFVIRGTDIPAIQAGEFDGCPYRFHKPSNLKSRSLQPGDFVFEVSGGSKDQLLGRNVFITDQLLKYLDAPVMAASFCKQIRFNRELVSPYFMKYFMKLYYDCDLVGIYQIQSTGISNYQFESFLKFQSIVLPPDELQNKFEGMVKPIIEMRDSISLANIELRKSRDLLLPRLISGKLSVEDLDIQFPPSMQEEANATHA